jgi:hypothetical protein
MAGRPHILEEKVRLLFNLFDGFTLKSTQDIIQRRGSLAINW